MAKYSTVETYYTLLGLDILEFVTKVDYPEVKNRKNPILLDNSGNKITWIFTFKPTAMSWCSLTVKTNTYLINMYLPQLNHIIKFHFALR